jgi:hypothetical protein
MLGIKERPVSRYTWKNNNKAMETTLRSSMDAQMLAMCDYFTGLMKLKAPPTIPIHEYSNPLLAGKDLGSPSNRDPGEDDVFAKNKDSIASSQKGADRKRASLKEKWRSHDPPIPHPHINNRGDPPKLDVSDFVNGNLSLNIMCAVLLISYAESSSGDTNPTM